MLRASPMVLRVPTPGVIPGGLDEATGRLESKAYATRALGPPGDILRPHTVPSQSLAAGRESHPRPLPLVQLQTMALSSVSLGLTLRTTARLFPPQQDHHEAIS